MFNPKNTSIFVLVNANMHEDGWHLCIVVCYCRVFFKKFKNSGAIKFCFSLGETFVIWPPCIPVANNMTLIK